MFFVCCVSLMGGERKEGKKNKESGRKKKKTRRKPRGIERKSRRGGIHILSVVFSCYSPSRQKYLCIEGSLCCILFFFSAFLYQLGYSFLPCLILEHVPSSWRFQITKKYRESLCPGDDSIEKEILIL